MKKHNLLKVTLLVLLLVVIGTWFLPVYTVSSASEGFTIQESIKVGLFNLASYVGIVLQVFGPVLLYVLSIGALYGVLYQIPQYRMLLDKIADGFKGKEWLFMTIVGVVFALLSSMAGLSVVLMLLFPFVISVILLMGYNRTTAALLVVGSVIAGLIGSVFDVNGVYGISAIFSQIGFEDAWNLAKLDVIWKIVLLVVSLALVLVNTFMYGKNHKKNDVDLEKSHLVPKKVKATNGKKIYPLVIVMDILLVVLTLAFISWDLFEVKLFEDLTNGFISPTGSSFVKGLYGGLNTVLGITVNNSTNNVFGHWTMTEASLVVFLATGLIAYLYRLNFNKFITSVEEGVKKSLRPALLVVIAYMILVVMVTVPYEFSFLRHIIDLESGFNLFIMCIVAFVFCFFTVESYYGIATAGSFVTLSNISTDHVGIIALIWQSMYGLAMLISPTSVILLATLSYVDISYGEWWKAVWKLFLELFAAILIILLLFNM